MSYVSERDFRLYFDVREREGEGKGEFVSEWVRESERVCVCEYERDSDWLRDKESEWIECDWIPILWIKASQSNTILHHMKVFFPSRTVPPSQPFPRSELTRYGNGAKTTYSRCESQTGSPQSRLIIASDWTVFLEGSTCLNRITFLLCIFIFNSFILF